MNNACHPLWTSLTLGRLTVPSRLVLPPMASGTASSSGHVTEATRAHYGRLVGPRVGLAFVEYAYVHASGRSEPHQLGVSDPSHAAGLAELAALIKSRGAVAGIQLTHAGGKTDAALSGGTPLGASALPIPAHQADFAAPAAMTESDIETLRRAFVAAALMAEEAGFGAIEIHAAHGYFFNQWLSPITNQRPDAHGGTMAARSRLLVELVETLRSVLRPETILSIRFAAQDRLDGGLTFADTLPLARRLAVAGMDVFNVSSGLGGWRRGREQRGEGYLVADATAVRRAVDRPVIGVGGIETLDYCAQALGAGHVDMVAVGRAILENPDWPKPLAACA